MSKTKANDNNAPPDRHFAVRDSQVLPRHRPRRGWSWSPAPPVPAAHGSGGHLLEFLLTERHLLPPLLTVYLPTCEVNSSAEFILYTNEFSPNLCRISAVLFYHFYWIMFFLPNTLTWMNFKDFTPKTVALELQFLRTLITEEWYSENCYYFEDDFHFKGTE